MADVTFTASAVDISNMTVLVPDQVSGGAFNAGRIVKKDADGRWTLAQANNLTNTANRTQLAIAGFTASGANQRGTLALEGDLTGDGLTAGKMYFLSNNAGGLIMPAADLVLAVGAIIVSVGPAVSTTVLRVRFHNTGIAVV